MGWGKGGGKGGDAKHAGKGKWGGSGKKDVSGGTAKNAKGKHAPRDKGGKGKGGGGSGNEDTAGGKWG
jgi:hypothetical protein